jgi:hypothetical protein
MCHNANFMRALRDEGRSAGVIETFGHYRSDEVQFRFVARSLDHELRYRSPRIGVVRPSRADVSSAPAPCWQAGAGLCGAMKVDRFSRRPELVVSVCALSARR